MRDKEELIKRELLVATPHPKGGGGGGLFGIL